MNHFIKFTFCSQVSLKKKPIFHSCVMNFKNRIRMNQSMNFMAIFTFYIQNKKKTNQVSVGYVVIPQMNYERLTGPCAVDAWIIKFFFFFNFSFMRPQNTIRIKSAENKTAWNCSVWYETVLIILASCMLTKFRIRETQGKRVQSVDRKYFCVAIFSNQKKKKHFFVVCKNW